MMLTCELCQSQFLTESDPHVVIPGPETKIYCYCQVKGNEQKWIDQLKHEHKLYQKHLNGLKAENERLEEEKDYLCKEMENMRDLHKHSEKILQDENAKLKECVEFYADFNSYGTTKNVRPRIPWAKRLISAFDVDDSLDGCFPCGGKRARQVLKELEEK